MPTPPDTASPTSASASSAPGPSPEALARTLARHPRPLGGDTTRSVGPAVVSLSGYVLNNQSEGPQQLRIGKKPDWLRSRTARAAAPATLPRPARLRVPLRYVP